MPAGLREAGMYTFTLTDDETELFLIALDVTQGVAQMEIAKAHRGEEEKLKAFRQKQLDGLNALVGKIQAEIASQRKLPV
jgi:hypothetical protein